MRDVLVRRDAIGRFAEHQRAETSVSLAPVEKPLQGSFLYPPRFKTAEELVDFWSRVEIPDAILDRISETWEDEHEDIVNGRRKHHFDDYDYLPFAMADPKLADDHPDAKARNERYVAARTEHAKTVVLADDIPEELDPRDIRTYARIYAIGYYADEDFDYAERKEALDTVVETPKGRMAIGRFYADSGLGRMSKAPLKAASYRPSSLIDTDDIEEAVEDAMEESFSKHEKKLDRALDELYAAIHGTAEVTIATADRRRRSRH
ncbi:MAG: hypothetical protein ACRCYU_11995 [Nocardioides sp.]